MPNYSYTCKTCKIDNVKQFLYRHNPVTNRIDLRVCEICANPVERKWSPPPKEWYRSISNRQNE